MNPLVPIRVNIETKLTEAEKDCIAWCVLSGGSQAEVFAIFCKPELKDSKRLLEKVSSQFFASAEVAQYMEAYKKVLEESQSVRQTAKPEKSYSPEEMKSRKERAMMKLMNYVIEQSNNIDNIDNKEDIIKFADKLGLLNNEEEVEEAPRRYLPETCSQCRYKAFVEENCKEL